MTTIALIAGETSGDQLGGWLMAALRAQAPEVRFMGVGGANMEAAGLASLFPMRDIALMGFAEILPHVRMLRRRIRETVEAIERARPDILVTIDSPGFTLRVVKQLRARGRVRPRFVHYVAPTVWAYKPKRAKKLAAMVDHLLCLLPFEPPYFTAEGLPTRFVGHEIAWWWKARGDGAAFRARHGIAADAPLLAVFPGSRRGEIDRLWPIFSQSIAQLSAAIAGLQVVIQVPPHLLAEMEARCREAMEPASQPPLTSDLWPLASAILLPSTEDKKGLFAAATAALAKSGTIGLECALAGLPSVIAYRAHPITAAMLRRMIRVKYVNLANILADRLIIPELIQEDCTPARIADALLPLLTDASAREAQRVELTAIAAMLGTEEPRSPSEKAAEVILGMV